MVNFTQQMSPSTIAHNFLSAIGIAPILWSTDVQIGVIKIAFRLLELSVANSGTLLFLIWKFMWMTDENY